MANITANPSIDHDSVSDDNHVKNGEVGVTTEPQSKLDVSDEYRATFLATFTPEEEHRIMRKVDYRILVLFGLIYMVKQVRASRLANLKVMCYTYAASDRRQQRRSRQSYGRRQTYQHP